MPRAQLRIALAVAALGTAATACLPTDTRTPPGGLYTTATASDMTLHGIPASATADGWSIRFERVLVGIGRVNLGERQPSCNRYSNRGYMRLLNLQVAGPQKLSQSYALGQCDVSFRVSYPGSESVLGAHTTNADRTFMDTPHPDGYEDPAYAGIAVYVQGTGTRGATVKHFAWAFRRRIEFTSCGNGPVDAGPRGFSFHSHDAFRADIAVHAEALFQDRRDPATAKLHFQPYADADSNQDGTITLEELDRVAAADAGIHDLLGAGAGSLDGGPPDGAPPDGAPPDVGIGPGALDAQPNDALAEGGTGGFATLEAYVYLALVPAMFRYQGVAGACTPGDVPNGRF